MTRFIARVEGFRVQQDYVILSLKMGEDQLGRVIHTVAYTGAGQPRPFRVRIATKEKAGLAWTGWLRRLNIDQYGASQAAIVFDLGFDMGVLAGLIEKNVAVEIRDVEQDDNAGKEGANQ